MPNDTALSGEARRRSVQGARSDELHGILEAMDPDIVKWMDGFIFEDVWGRPGLDLEDRLMVTIALLTASNKPEFLKSYASGALQYGVKTRKIHEAIVMSQVYCGFPTMLTALRAWRETLAEAGRTLDDDA